MVFRRGPEGAAHVVNMLLPKSGEMSLPKKSNACKYNQECWLKVRLPLIKKHKNLYLPYECSYVAMGDLENCSLRDGFAAKEAERLKEQESVEEGV